MRTLSLTLQLVNHPLSLMPLYHHQAIMLDEWDNYNTFLVETKTGTGKTVAAVLPILKAKESAIMVYPTNELIRNQVASVANIVSLEGLKPCIYSPETTKEEFGRADVLLVHIDAAALVKWGKEKGLGSKWKVLSLLLEINKPVKIIFTNPDILFLIFALRFRGEALAALQGYRTLVVDEFHLYQGVEFAHALFMVHLARHMKMFERVVLLSATPDPEVKSTVRDFFDPFEIDLSSRSKYMSKVSRTAVHEVEIVPCPAGLDPVDTAVNTLLLIKKKLIELREQENELDYIPAVVVLNSVINAIRLEDLLVNQGFSRDELLIVRGLSHRGIRQKHPKHLLVIGTSAIEVGVDFKCDYLIFEASEAPSFMQRFGRVGRHKPGTAYIICPENVRSGIEGLNAEVTRDEFETRVYEWYVTPESRPWFVSTRGGIITVYALLNNIIQGVKDGYRGNPEEIITTENRLEEIADKYAQKVHCERFMAATRSQFAKAEQDMKYYMWLKSYQELNTFRTSLPSIRVYDHAERTKRGEKYASYDVDLVSLLRRAEGLVFDAKLSMVTVKGYGRYKRIH